MIRRCKIVALLLAYLASQVAAIPHAHAAGEGVPADHGQRPHIHLSRHAHGHGHGGLHHHHDHSAAHSHGLATNTEVANGEEPDHDSDAVYLPSNLGGLHLSIHAAQFQGPSEIPAQFVIVPVFNSEATSIRPDALGCGGLKSHQPLYLALRALRI